MFLKLTLPKIIQIVCAFIMVFCLGVQCEVSVETSRIAKIVGWIMIGVVWVFIIAGV